MIVHVASLGQKALFAGLPVQEIKEKSFEKKKRSRLIRTSKMQYMAFLYLSINTLITSISNSLSLVCIFP